MKKILNSVIAGLLLTATVTSASAAVVSLGSMSKTYGTGNSTASTGAGSCDTLNASSIKVTDTSTGCTRFLDEFNFKSSFQNYSSIDYLTLTLSFGATNDLFAGLFREDWKVKLAGSASSSSPVVLDMDNVSGTTTQTFTLDASQAAVLASVAANGKLSMWFGDEALGANNFNLYSARLEVFGTAVPEPASLGLFSLAFGALAMVRRRKMR